MRIIGNDPSVPRQTQEVASGAITNGKAVVVNANGTVSTISTTAASVGTKSAANALTSSFTNCVFDSSNNKHIIVYRTSSNMRYVVATVASDGGVTFGTDAAVVSGDMQQIRACFDSTNNRIVAVVRNSNDSDHGYAIVGSLSGTTVTWGSLTEFENASTKQMELDFDSTAGKVVIAYSDAGNSQYGTAIVGTVSGTSISFGTPVVYESASSQKNTVIYDSTNNKTVIGFMDQADGEKGKCVVGTVSGTSISFGSTVEFQAGEVGRLSGAFDSANSKVVFTFNDSLNNHYPTAIVGTVSGTSISFGTKAVITSEGTAGGAYGEAPRTNYDVNTGKIITVYLHTVDGSFSNYGYVSAGAVSGTDISFDTKVAFNTAATVYPDISFDSNVNKNLISFGDGGNSEYLTAVSFVPLSTNLTSENYIGISRSGAADTKGAIVDTQGAIADNLSGLTAGQSYYVQNDGTLGTTAADPSVFAGTAVSATKLIVKG